MNVINSICILIGLEINVYCSKLCNYKTKRKTLKLNFKGLTEPRIYNEISSFLDIKSHLDFCFETPSDIIINAIKEKVLVKKKEKTIKS